MTAVYGALVHHPVRNREGRIVATAVTNLDVHDLARSGRTYDLAGVFIVTPVDAQRRLVGGILSHWQEGAAGALRIPERSEALGRCAAVSTIDEACERIAEREGQKPLRWVTSASPPPSRALLSFPEAVRQLGAMQAPVLLLFGTGHGLAPSIVAEADAVLAPIRPGSGYNHLSVRSAAAIVFDRLFGDGAEHP